jgi:hypothetical protein
MSSTRQTNVPARLRTDSQIANAVRALPTWTRPVGDGANRPRGRAFFVTAVMGSARIRRPVPDAGDVGDLSGIQRAVPNATPASDTG